MKIVKNTTHDLLVEASDTNPRTLSARVDFDDTVQFAIDGMVVPKWLNRGDLQVLRALINCALRLIE